MSSTSELNTPIDVEVEESPLLDLLNGFIVELRLAGLPVSLTESLDAMEAVSHIPIEDRDAFKYALGATLVKNYSHWKSFELVFEVYFSIRGSEYEITEDDLTNSMADELAETEYQQGDAPAGGSWSWSSAARAPTINPRKGRKALAQSDTRRRLRAVWPQVHQRRERCK